MLVLLYGQTRIFYTMARDGLIPPVFAQVHPKFKTPWINTLIVGVLACGFAGFMGLDHAREPHERRHVARVRDRLHHRHLSALRASRHAAAVQDAAVPRSRRCWAPSMCLFLLMSLMATRETRNFFIVYLVVGIVLYFVYGMWNSKLGKGVVVRGHEVLAETPHPKGLD